MSQTYTATGINLKGMPFGESDRLITVLTEEYGLLRAIVPGARKHQSRIGARSSLFVVNQLLIVKGRNLDKIIQAETVESFPKLGQDLGRLTASQYLAELVLHQALSDQPQVQLVTALRHYLREFEQSPLPLVLPSLVHGILYFLATAGLAPQVHRCGVTQQEIHPDPTDPQWQVGFSASAGGLIRLDAASAARSPRLRQPAAAPSEDRDDDLSPDRDRASLSLFPAQVAEPVPTRYRTVIHPTAAEPIQTRLQAMHVRLLQALIAVESEQPTLLDRQQLSQMADWHETTTWWPALRRVEQVLRAYAQYHLERPVQSAALIDACFQTQG